MATVLSAVIALCSGAAPPANGFDESEMKHIAYPDWFSDSPFSDLAEELEEARGGDRLGLMVLFTTEGCSYCERFIATSLGDAELASRVQAHFRSLGLEMFDDTGMTDPRGASLTVKQFAEREGAEFSPTLLFYGQDGERMLRVVGYQSPERFRMILDYLTGGYFRGESLADYIKRRAHAAARAATGSRAGLKPDPLFASPPYALDRSRFPADQPLLVLFEQSACADCEQFHAEVLAVDEVRELLGTFEVVRLDSADQQTPVIAPDGSRLTPAAWFARTGFSRVPALLLFDEQGRRVLQTDALVLRQRMINALHYVLERAYDKGWSYQRFARARAIAARQGQGHHAAE